jgi:hypothetical protein
VEQQTKAIIANACYQTAYLTNWKLMEPLGSGLENNTVTWDPIQQAIAVLAANKSLHLYVWKAIAPAAWNTYVVPGIYDASGCIGPAEANFCFLWDRYLYNGHLINYRGAFIGPSSSSVDATSIDELVGSGSVTDPAHFHQSYAGMLYGKDGWDFSAGDGEGVPTCYMKSCPDYWGGGPPQETTFTDPLFGVPKSRLFDALDTAQRLLRSVDKEVSDTADREKLKAPVLTALQQLRKASKSGRSTQIQAADGMIHFFTLRARTYANRQHAQDAADNYLQMAYRIRSLLVENDIATSAIPRPFVH